MALNPAPPVPHAHKKILAPLLLLTAFVTGAGLLLYVTGLLDVFLDRERLLAPRN